MADGGQILSELTITLQHEARELGAALVLVAMPVDDRWRILGASARALTTHKDPIHLWPATGDVAGAPRGSRPPAAVSSVLGRRPSQTWMSPAAADTPIVAVYWTNPVDIPADALEAVRNRVIEAVSSASPKAWGDAGSDLLGQIIERLPVGLIYFDNSRPRVAANRFARQLLNLPSAYVSPRVVAERLERLGVTAPHDAEAFRTRNAYGDICVGGNLYAVTSLVLDGARKQDVVWRIEDVTEVRAVEARLSEAKRALLLSQVSGGIGHEFNNLLSRVICLAEDIQDEADPERVHAHAETLIETSERGAEIVRRLMTYAGSTVVDLKPVHIGHELAKWGDGQDAADLTVEVDGCNATATLDPVLLKTVLDELLKNARQSGATRIRVICEQKPDHGAPTVTFRDNGPGMDPAAAARATEPFFTTREVGQGVGLGLSMVKGALDQWGGRMQLVSRPGKGTEVRLLLSTPGRTASADL